MTKKTDNHNLRAKLDLRRHFLQTSKEPNRVFDAFQASGRIWTQLRNEFAVETYWGVDIEGKRGRLKIDSWKILSQPGWKENIIDLDNYGSPWRQWMAVLENADGDVTVFMTIGKPNPMAGGARNVSNLELEIMGCKFKTFSSIPPTLTAKFEDDCVSFCLAQALEKFTILDAVEADNPGGSARYIGIRLAKLAPAALRANKQSGKPARTGGAMKE